MEQLFLSLRFNLRSAKDVDKRTMLMCVINTRGKQYRIASGVKVYPNQWNKKKQIAVISNIQSNLDNYNNRVVNDKIDELKQSFSNYLDYLCSGNDFTLYSLKSFMNKETNKTAKEIITEAYNHLFNGKNTYKTYMAKLNAFTKYLDEQNLTDLSVFTQGGINAYKKYLQDNNDTNVTLNRKCELIVRLINQVLAVENQFLDYGIIGNVKYNKEADYRPNKSRFALMDDELKAIANVKIDKTVKYSFDDVAPKDDNGKVNNKYRTKKDGALLSEYRDIFLLQCHIGQRVSDLIQFLNGDYSVITGKDENGKEYTYYKILTQKSGKKIESYVLKDEYIINFLSKYKKGFSFDVSKLGTDNSYYNLAIKKLCKMADLNRIIEYRNPKDELCKSMVWEIVVNHCARHTFITNKVREGMSPDHLCYLTGHTDDTMIKNIYSHITSKDKANILANEESRLNDEPKKKVAPLDAMFAYSLIKNVQAQQSSGVFADVETLRKIAAVIKSTKVTNIPKQDQTKANEIGGFIWNVAKRLAEPKVYQMYQYKLVKSGLLDKVDDINTLEDVMQQETANDEIEFWSDSAQYERYRKKFC